MTQEMPQRRVPRQERSQQRVELILDTAADLFAEIGFEATTTNALAARADISIGSLYQYFSDKDAILNALAERYVTRMQTLFAEVFTEDVVYLPLEVVLDRLIDPFVKFHRECPGFKPLMLGGDLSPDIAAATLALEKETEQHIINFIQLGAPQLPQEQAALMGQVCKVVVKAMLTLIEDAADEAWISQVSAEIKRLLFAYLIPIFVEEPPS